MYWIYRTQNKTWRGKPVQAILIDPTTGKKIRFHTLNALKSPMQDEPYGVDLDLTFQVNPRHTHPDNYLDSVGFQIYSERLVRMMQVFRVNAETYPIKMVDPAGDPLLNLKYYIFHHLEGVLPAMDEVRSGWTGDRNVGIPRLIVDPDKFPHRPIFICNHIYIPLMREDLKQAIQEEKITGFDFLRPENYRSGQFGIVFNYDE